MAGSVSGWTTRVVTPPAAAARLADFSVSFGSEPGSPVFTRMSTRPGMSARPAQSCRRRSGEKASRTAVRRTSAITPSATTTQPGPS